MALVQKAYFIYAFFMPLKNIARKKNGARRRHTINEEETYI